MQRPWFLDLLRANGAMACYSREPNSRGRKAPWRSPVADLPEVDVSIPSIRWPATARYDYLSPYERRAYGAVPEKGASFALAANPREQTS